MRDCYQQQGDGLEPLDGRPCPGDEPKMSFETEIQQILKPDVMNGALYAEDLHPSRRRQAVALHLDAQHRDGQTDLDWLEYGAEARREQHPAGNRRNMKLMGHVASYLYDGNESAARACMDEIFARAERYHYDWLDEQIMAIRAETHEEQPNTADQKYTCPECGAPSYGAREHVWCKFDRQAEAG